uniref:tRNA-splicing endonuclease subunit Sen2-like n=1 Tax=Styela clava TaxID=7725 RepID=UPI00193A242B|nr:tRNA-splicing endonuclease subunit Sen2-like [Styela clava]
MPKKIQKKKRCQSHPFPLTTFERKDLNSWTFYTADIHQLTVVVKDKDEADAMHEMGSFGTWADDDTMNIEGASAKDTTTKKFIMTYEEAFFLSFALGCLFISYESKEIDISEQWNLFCSKKKRFPVTYAVYHHFRTKGWVPKEGLKFGTDYILYKHGPSYTHAAYAVIIQEVNDDLTNSDRSSRHLTWTSMAGLGRLVSSVSKSLLICSITSTNIDTSSPNCLKQMNIYETVFSRWMSSKEQEDELDVDTVF